MSLSIGIVGLPNVGKSTLFRALTKKEVQAENYPFCTIDPSVGIVPVPDPRIDALAAFSKSVQKVPPIVEFVDIAGLVEGASKGEGLGNQFLSHIRKVDAILHLVRIFPIEGERGVTHVYGNVDPLRDISVITMELILSDLETVNRRIGKIERDVKRGDKQAQEEMQLLMRLREHLEAEKPANTFSYKGEERDTFHGLHLLTEKPVLYGLNRKSGVKNIDESDPEQFSKLESYITESGAQYVFLDAKTEDDLRVFSEDEKGDMREEFGITESGINALVRASYELLGLITFFTTGEKETRGWTIVSGSTAPEAGAAIHTDFQKNFIRASVINWQQLLDAGSYAQARANGLVRTEGKQYVVQDGDVIEFRV